MHSHFSTELVSELYSGVGDLNMRVMRNSILAFMMSSGLLFGCAASQRTSEAAVGPSAEGPGANEPTPKETGRPKAVADSAKEPEPNPKETGRPEKAVADSAGDKEPNPKETGRPGKAIADSAGDKEPNPKETGRPGKAVAAAEN
jgi:hypothetical protein